MISQHPPAHTYIYIYIYKLLIKSQYSISINYIQLYTIFYDLPKLDNVE